MKYIHTLCLAKPGNLHNKSQTMGYHDLRENSQSSLCWTLSNLRLNSLPGTKEFWGCSESIKFVNNLKLKYDAIYPMEDVMRNIPSRMWSYPKLHVISQQTEPFYHIDGDVFLSRELPEKSFLVQNLETFKPENSTSWFYGLHAFLLKAKVEDPLMDTVWEVAHSLNRGSLVNIWNCGVVGGTSPEIPKVAGELCAFIRKYADVLENVGSRVFVTCTLEQTWLPLLLMAKGVEPAVLLGESTIQEDADKAGYCHVLGHTKKIPANVAKIRDRVAEINPEMPILRYPGDVYYSGSAGSKLPPLSAMAKSFVTSVGAWAKKGFKTVSAEDLEKRRSICTMCEFWEGQAFDGSGRCRKCGCSTWAKLRMSTEKCPIDKWGPV